jgi:hypothetical protein
MFDLRCGVETVFHPISLRLGPSRGDRDDIRIDNRFPEYTESPASSGSCTSSTRLWICRTGQRSLLGRRSDEPPRSAGGAFAEHELRQSAGITYAGHVMAR